MVNQAKVIFDLTTKGEKSINRLAKDIKEPVMSVYRACKNLENEGIIAIKKIGKSSVCGINTGQKRKMMPYLLIAENERLEEALKKHPFLLGLTKESDFKGLFLLALFGSYAAGRPAKESDVDVLLVTDKKDHLLPRKIESMLRNYGKNAHLVAMPAGDFKRALAAKEHTLIDEVIRDHIILCKPDNFWNAVLEAEHA